MSIEKPAPEGNEVSSDEGELGRAVFSRTQNHETGGGKNYPRVRKVLLRVLFANLGVSIVKILLGLLTGALSVVADGFHSLVDTSSNLIGLAAVRLADRPADERHPYGYGRYETIGAMAIGVMLLVAAWGIGRAIITRLVEGLGPEFEPLLIGVYAITIPVNLGITIYETRAGRRLGSEILLADAAHTRTDIYISLSVLASLVGTTLGWGWLDILVAGGVVLLILKAAFEIIRDSAGWLTDVRVADANQIEAIARSVPGVLYVHQIRSRGTPSAGFVDLHVKVHPGMSTSQAHAIASAVENRLVEELPQVIDALVHIEPGSHKELNAWEQISYDLRKIADGMGVGLHDLHVHADGARGYALELHLEMNGEITLGEAHELAERFEEKVRQFWPAAGSIITHLEPVSTAVLESRPIYNELISHELEQAVLTSLGEGEILEIQFLSSRGEGNLAVRACVPANLSLKEAHNRAEKVERDLLIAFPELARVTVHLEPDGPS